MSVTAQKTKFSITEFFSKCDQIRRKHWSHLVKKSVIENFIFCAVHKSTFSSKLQDFWRYDFSRDLTHLALSFGTKLRLIRKKCKKLQFSRNYKGFLFSIFVKLLFYVRLKDERVFPQIKKIRKITRLWIFVANISYYMWGHIFVFYSKRNNFRPN